MKNKEFEGWSEEKLNIVEELYKRMLFLWVKYSNISLPPSKDVDTFWHYHILDTRKYHMDCKKIFGFYRHHNPYFGIGNKEAKNNLQQAFKNTLYYYYNEFKEELYDIEELHIN